MKVISKTVLIGALLGLSIAPSFASVISSISFKSNGLAFVNDTIVDATTSPLAFTTTGDLDLPFLNAADSTVTLGLGNYYAIAFLGFGQHLGEGEISFRVDGGNLITQAVTFPDPSAASGIFANFSLPGGDSVTIASAGLAKDRIRIVADGGGLQTDGTQDAFYQFNFTSAVPEPTTLALVGLALAVLVSVRKQPK